jgi:hypothetical protein
MAPIIPDPEKRSVKDPIDTLTKAKAVKIYNKENRTNYKICTNKITEFIKNKAIVMGWSKVHVTKQDIVLVANVTLESIKVNRTVAKKQDNVVRLKKRA